jgi:hypothetical protein
MSRILFCQQCGYLLCNCTCTHNYQRGLKDGAKAERERIKELIKKTYGWCNGKHDTCFKCWLKAELMK